MEFAPPDGVQTHAPRLAVFADPWPGLMAVYVASEGGGFSLGDDAHQAARRWGG